MKPRINIALIGQQFMGRAHSHALKCLHMLCQDLPVEPVMRVICGRDEAALRKTADQFGWEHAVTDWREAVEDPEVHVVDVVTPGNLHREISVAAAENGKHVFCEKPLANCAADAEAMYEAADRNAVKHMVNFNYRRVPAVVLAKQMVEAGRLGEIYHFQAQYQQDWSLSPSVPFVWRFDKAVAGAGSMADMGSHIIDLARHLVGEFEQVACRARVCVPERKDATGQSHSVTTDDAAAFISQFTNGALGVFLTSRTSAGHKNGLQFEINGSLGSIRFSLERLNELEVFFADDDDDCNGFRTVSVTQAGHPYLHNWWPPGHVLGWEHTFTHQWHELLSAIAYERTPTPSFFDGMQCQRVAEAVCRATETTEWVSIR